ncbi:hypothetical protein DL96DRAFT_1717671 [Flagelloscypha sp. PMI_526]|nr:hypothetical protein DL96DRAFT_1717671 [Flagelloscypha sp. PMI_526]
MDESTATDSGPSNTNTSTHGRSRSVQVAAQEYPWLYMTSSLDKCFGDSEGPVLPADQPKELQDDEPENSDSAVVSDEPTTADSVPDPADISEPFQAAQSIEFYDDLDSDKFASEGPKIIQAFLVHEKSSTEAEHNALSIASSDVSSHPTSDVFDTLITQIDQLVQESRDLEDAVRAFLHAAMPLEDDPIAQFVARVQAEEAPPVGGKEEDKQFGRAMILHVFTSTLPVLKARGANLGMALELVQGAKESWVMERRLEELDFGDDDLDEEDNLARRVEQL